MEAIKVTNLTKHYKGNPSPAIERLSLSIACGEIYGLLGPNGAGKTTLIHILCGLTPFDSGEVEVNGCALKSEMKKIKPMIGFVPQDIALYPTLTAYENLTIFAGLYNLGKTEAERRINEYLSLFGLQSGKHRCIKHYSGGMKRRINLIAGLLHQPKVLFLDEPTVGVDVQSKNVILENLRNIHAQGISIVYTSHDMEEAEGLCTKVAFIDEGKLIYTGVPKEITGEGRTLESLYLQLTGKRVRD